MNGSSPFVADDGEQVYGTVVIQVEGDRICDTRACVEFSLTRIRIHARANNVAAVYAFRIAKKTALLALRRWVAASFGRPLPIAREQVRRVGDSIVIRTGWPLDTTIAISDVRAEMLDRMMSDLG